MSSPGHRLLHVDDLTVEVTRRSVKRARLVVRPDGNVRLSAPQRMSERQLRAFVLDNRDWLLRTMQRQRNRQMPVDDLTDGGSMTLWGSDIAVERSVGRTRATLQDGRVRITAPDDTAAERAAHALRQRLLAEAVERLAPPLQDRVGRAPSAFRYRAMTSRWGSCNVQTRVITLNTWLVQRPEAELEYVLAHELAHLVEAGHGPRFYAVLDRALPDWKQRRAELRNHIPPRG